MADQDEDALSTLVAEYYEFLRTGDGRHREVLARELVTDAEREALEELLDTVEMFWGLTAPLREASRAALN